MEHVQRSEDNTQESVLSLHCVDPMAPAQVTGTGGEHLHTQLATSMNVLTITAGQNPHAPVVTDPVYCCAVDLHADSTLNLLKGNNYSFDFSSAKGVLIEIGLHHFPPLQP